MSAYTVYVYDPTASLTIPLVSSLRDNDNFRCVSFIDSAPLLESLKQIEKPDCVIVGLGECEDAPALISKIRKMCPGMLILSVSSNSPKKETVSALARAGLNNISSTGDPMDMRPMLHRHILIRGSKPKVKHEMACT